MARQGQFGAGSSVAITGATGFIGRHLVRELSRRGYLVRVLLRVRSICNWTAPALSSATFPPTEPVGRLGVPDGARGRNGRGAAGHRRNLTMLGLSATVGEQIEALRRVAGDAAVKRIRREPDPVVAGTVAGWPRASMPLGAQAGLQGRNPRHAAVSGLRVAVLVIEGFEKNEST